jgi:hypothetical protein
MNGTMGDEPDKTIMKLVMNQKLMSYEPQHKGQRRKLIMNQDEPG